MTNNDQTLPHWDLTNVYPGLDSTEFEAAREEIKTAVAELENFIEENHISRSSVPSPDADLTTLGELVAEIIEEAGLLPRRWQYGKGRESGRSKERDN